MMRDGGYLPKGWAISSIGEVATYLNGRAFKPSEWEELGLPIIRIQNLNDPDARYNRSTETYEDRYVVKNGDLLFAWAASLGAFIWKGQDAWLNQHIFKVVPKIDKQFLYYLLLQTTAEIYAKAHGSGMVHVTKGVFEATPIALPPLAEQRRIVAKIEELFSELDKGVESLTTAREQLKAYRQSVLKAAFSGELLGFGSRGWTEHTVGQLAIDIRYGTAKKCEVDPAKTPVLRIPNVASGRIDLTDLKHAEFSTDELDKLRLQRGDILIVRSNGSASLVGLSAIVTDEAVGYAYAGYLIRLRIKKDLVLPAFLNFYLHSPMVRAGIERQARSSSGVHNVNSDEIRAITLKIPPIPMQQKIIGALSEIGSQIDALDFSCETELARSDALRQSILQRAFSGQLVAQNPTDEPASALLECIRAEHEEDGSAKKQRNNKNGKKVAA